MQTSEIQNRVKMQMLKGPKGILEAQICPGHLLEVWPCPDKIFRLDSFGQIGHSLETTTQQKERESEENLWRKCFPNLEG